MYLCKQANFKLIGWCSLSAETEVKGSEEGIDPIVLLGTVIGKEVQKLKLGV